MPPEDLVKTIVWFLPVPLQLAAATLIYRRKLYLELRMFLVFVLFDAAFTTVGWFLHNQFPVYFYFYWIAEAVGAVLGLAVIHEIFRNVVQRYEAIHHFGDLVYRWAAVVLLVVAIITAANAPGLGSGRIIEGILTLERGVRIIQAGLLFLLFVFASYLGLSWRSSVFGIALGFGIYASIELALVAVRAHAGPAANQLYVWLKPCAWALTTLLWAGYLLLPQPKVQTITSLSKPEIAVWDEALMEYLRR